MTAPQVATITAVGVAHVVAVGVAHVTPRGDAVPCVARPSTGCRHYDGPCRCFTGGPAPTVSALALRKWVVR